MTKKWNLIVDVAGCENCNNCALATKDEFDGNRFEGYSAPHPRQGRGVLWLERKVRGTGHMVDTAYRPTMCMHCDDGPCLKVGADGAVRKRDDGIVIIDPVKAKGRRDLVDACPYGAIVWNEIEMLPQTWYFDAHLIDQGWPAPRCVGVCPTGALKVMALDDEDMQAQAQNEGLRVLHPEFGTKPRVYYRHLDRFDGVFIAATVLQASGGVEDCAVGVSVTLSQEGRDIASSVTDVFGDVKFDSLDPNSGEYILTFGGQGHAQIQMPVMLGFSSVWLDEVRLQPVPA